MNRRLALIMDPIESIKPQKDSTLAVLLHAQSRGWTIHYGQLSDIWLRDGEAYGHLTQLNVADDPAHWFDPGAVSVAPLGDRPESSITIASHSPGSRSNKKLPDR